MKENEVIRITNEIMNKENCTAEIKFKRGYANYVQNGKIYFGVKYIENYERTQVIITIIEEISHVKIGSGHSKEWAILYLELLNRYLKNYI